MAGRLDSKAPQPYQRPSPWGIPPAPQQSRELLCAQLYKKRVSLSVGHGARLRLFFPFVTGSLLKDGGGKTAVGRVVGVIRRRLVDPPACSGRMWSRLCLKAKYVRGASAQHRSDESCDLYNSCRGSTCGGTLFSQTRMSRTFFVGFWRHVYVYVYSMI